MSGWSLVFCETPLEVVAWFEPILHGPRFRFQRELFRPDACWPYGRVETPQQHVSSPLEVLLSGGGCYYGSAWERRSCKYRPNLKKIISCVCNDDDSVVCSAIPFIWTPAVTILTWFRVIRVRPSWLPLVSRSRKKISVALTSALLRWIFVTLSMNLLMLMTHSHYFSLHFET